MADDRNIATDSDQFVHLTIVSERVIDGMDPQTLDHLAGHFISDGNVELARIVRQAAAEIRRLRARVAEMEAAGDGGPTVRELDIDELIAAAADERARLSDFDRLAFDADVSDVSPVVKGTWVRVDDVVAMIVDGYTWDDVLRTHPELAEDDIRACLAYAMDQAAR